MDWFSTGNRHDGIYFPDLVVSLNPVIWQFAPPLARIFYLSYFNRNMLFILGHLCLTYLVGLVSTWASS